MCLRNILGSEERVVRFAKNLALRSFGLPQLFPSVEVERLGLGVGEPGVVAELLKLVALAEPSVLVVEVEYFKEVVVVHSMHDFVLNASTLLLTSRLANDLQTPLLDPGFAFRAHAGRVVIGRVHLVERAVAVRARRAVFDAVAELGRR